MIITIITHRIHHGAAIYGNMDPINIPPMLAYIPAPWILWVTAQKKTRSTHLIIYASPTVKISACWQHSGRGTGVVRPTSRLWGLSPRWIAPIESIEARVLVMDVWYVLIFGPFWAQNTWYDIMRGSCIECDSSQ